MTLYDPTTLEPVGSTPVDGIIYAGLSQRCPPPADRRELVNGLSITAANLPTSLPEGEPLNIEVGWLVERQPKVVTDDHWKLIDDHERGAGEPHGRPRVKLTSVAELLRIGHG